MGTQTTTIYTCDRDGAASEPSSSGLPPGWTSAEMISTTGAAPPSEEGATVFTADTGPTNTRLILCPAYSAAFADALETFKGAGS